MRILCTSPFVPYPPNYGGAMVPYSHFKGLAERQHEIVMVLPLRRANDESNASPLREIGKVRSVRVSEKSVPMFALEALASRTSLRVARHRLPAMRREMASALREEKPFDVVYLDSFFTTYLLPVIRELAPRTPVVLLAQNVESQVMQRLVQQRRDVMVRLASLWETPALGASERWAYQNLDQVMTLSDEDAAQICATAPGARAVTLGPGIETYSGEAIPRPQEPIVLFLGSYQWPPNVDAAQWMAQEIWPRVRARVPAARLVLAGHDPKRQIAPLADEHAGISVPGFVPNAKQTTRAASVCVAPLRIGGGVRLKILEALANERPVVTTAIGAEGLGLVPGEHAHFADDADAFAATVARLLGDESEAARSARAGRRHVEGKFAWPRVIERLERILEEVIREGRPS